MQALSWLTARPVAHRGLHDANAGIIENTTSAFNAAITANYAFECDLQITSDGEAVVHHDDQLGRLTEGSGRLETMTAAELKHIPYKASADRIITVGELCDFVAGRVTMLIELKSRFDGDMRVVERAAQVIAAYNGPAALMSFDPAQIAHLRTVAPRITRGIVAESQYLPEDWRDLPQGSRRTMMYFCHAFHTRPHFIAFSVRNLPALVPFVARNVFGRPLLTWTVRTQADQDTAARFADQMIFEGFRP
jgi:glycerophosphoryl diester phosphodiesterase